MAAAGVKWLPVLDQRNQPIGWKIDGHEFTVKVVQNSEQMWVGTCELFGYQVLLDSMTHISARREFLKMCYRRARRIAVEMERAWEALGKTTLVSQEKEETSGK